MSFRYLFYIFFIFSFAIPGSSYTLQKSDIPIVNCALNRADKRKCEVAICAMFRDEGNYLKEWIEYHRMLGVKHFYLYNNCSQDNFWEILQSYVKKGIVELFDVPFDSSPFQDGAKTHNFVQVCCYTHAINLAKKNNKWLAIIDNDEFICPVVDSSIPEALQRYAYAGGVVLFWQIYGTSNVWDLQPGELMIEKLLYKGPNDSGVGQFKSIVKPEYVEECMDPHWTKTKKRPLMYPNHVQFRHSPGFKTLPVDVIRINHYTYRTQSFYETVKKPRRALWGFNPTPEYDQQLLNYYNSESDPVMLRFVSELKKRMFQ